MKWFPLLLSCLLVSSAIPALAQDSRQLLSEGQRALSSGDVTTAKAKFEQVLSIDPKNPIAKNYLRTMQAQEASSGGAQLEKQLKTLILPKVEFRDATFSSALDYLKQQAAKVSNGQVQVSFVVQLPEEFVRSKNITLSLANVPFTEALRYVGDIAEVRFSVEKYAIVVKPRAGAGAPQASNVSSPAQ
jgi:hypothetical protein